MPQNPWIGRLTRRYHIWIPTIVRWARGKPLVGFGLDSKVVSAWSYAPLLRALALVALVSVAMLSIWLYPTFEDQRWKWALREADRPMFVIEARRNVVQFWGGVVVLLGLYLGLRRIVATDEANRLQSEKQLIDREGQVTQRFTAAVEQLGHDKAEVRLGAIFALERIANDSIRDAPTITETLSAYIRNRCTSVAPPMADVQAALTVLGRRSWAEKIGYSMPVDLTGAVLDGYDLSKASLKYCIAINASFRGSNLRSCDLCYAKLQGASLDGAVATSAKFRGISAFSSKWTGAHLGAADMTRANLQRATMKNATLHRALFVRARLNEADLSNAAVDGADFSEADLTGSNSAGVDLRQLVFRRGPRVAQT
jgi:uncharacterized protein YjbI with pentapeptide repeats